MKNILRVKNERNKKILPFEVDLYHFLKELTDLCNKYGVCFVVGTMFLLRKEDNIRAFAYDGDDRTAHPVIEKMKNEKNSFWKYYPYLLEIRFSIYTIRLIKTVIWKPQKYLRHGVGYGNHFLFLCFEFIWLNKK